VSWRACGCALRVPQVERSVVAVVRARASAGSVSDHACLASVRTVDAGKARLARQSTTLGSAVWPMMAKLIGKADCSGRARA